MRRIKQIAPSVRIVAFALAEQEEAVIAWAEAGVSAYIPRSASLDELVPMLERAMRDEQFCSMRVASGLLRRIAAGGSAVPTTVPIPLTPREMEIIGLINEGLSNKEIARRLGIGVGTTKTHVHNALEKLGLGRRSQAARWLRERACAHPRSSNPSPSSSESANHRFGDCRRQGTSAAVRIDWSTLQRVFADLAHALPVPPW